MTSQGCSLEMVPLIRSTSLDSIHHIRPTEWWPWNTSDNSQLDIGLYSKSMTIMCTGNSQSYRDTKAVNRIDQSKLVELVSGLTDTK